MSDQVLTTLKATRIVELQAAIVASEKELAEARKSLMAAKLTTAGTTTPAERRQAEKAQQAAEAELSAAETKLEFQREELRRLLGNDRWYDRIPWMSFVSFAFFGIFGGIVLKAILNGIENKVLLESLQNIPSSRGLITFLVTLITVTIALILALSTIVSNSPDRAERFKDGKDLLFALIGVLGTIIGFYFGQLESGKAELQLAPIVVTNEVPTVGESFNLVSFASGGEAPYTFEIVFDPEVTEAITVESPNGVLNRDITIEQDVDAETPITLTLKVTDSKGATVTSDAKAIKVKPLPLESEAPELPAAENEPQSGL